MKFVKNKAITKYYKRGSIPIYAIILMIAAVVITFLIWNYGLQWFGAATSKTIASIENPQLIAAPFNKFTATLHVQQAPAIRQCQVIVYDASSGSIYTATQTFSSAVDAGHTARIEVSFSRANLRSGYMYYVEVKCQNIRGDWVDVYKGRLIAVSAG